MVDEDKFYACPDGELSRDEAAGVEAEVAADPKLSRLAEEHRKMTGRLCGAFGAVEAQPVPERVQAALLAGSDSKVVDLARSRAARDYRRAPRLWAQMAALAATLAIGVLAGNMLTSGIFGVGSSSPIETEGGRLVAWADLEGALYSRLASVPFDSGPQIGLTFRDRSGAICRTFEDGAASGMACRESGDWKIRSLFQGAEGQATEYRMASGSDPRLLEAVDAAIEGEPFDAAQEKAAMERGWR